MPAVLDSLICGVTGKLAFLYSNISGPGKEE